MHMYSTGSRVLAQVVLTCLLCAISLTKTYAGKADRDLYYTNEVEPQPQRLPDCDVHTVCGYVQLNLHGVSVQPLCRCRRGVTCPLVWDPLDGRTVAHGNDQYKFCDRAPPLDLCTTRQAVYSSYMEMSLMTMETVVNKVRVHCLCPPTHLFTRNHTEFLQLEGVTAFSISYLCKPPPICGRSDPCMAVTKSYHDSTSFVTRNCACPLGLFCPNQIRLAYERVDLDRGAYYVMRCL